MDMESTMKYECDEDEFYATYLGHMLLICFPTNDKAWITLKAMVRNIFDSYSTTLN